MKQFYTGEIAKTPRIQKLIDDMYAVTPEIESERAILVTESYKQTEALPIVLRRAKAFEHILMNMPIVIRDGELIAGNLTKKPRACQIYPEYSNKWLVAEFDTLAKRTGDVFNISEQTKRELSEVFTYWDGKTCNELALEYMYPETKLASDHGVFTVGNYCFNGVGHIGVDYEKVLKKGFLGIIEEVKAEFAKADTTCPEFIKKRYFLEAVLITSQAIINFAGRFAALASSEASATNDPVRREELLQIARNCERVPANPAQSFYEALQCFWFVQMAIQLESNGHSISPLRFDQYMWPYYKQDIASGVITREKAQELLDCVWIKFNDVNKVRDEGSTKAFGGYPMFQNLIVGGQTSEGIDATNDLSFACLEASAHTRLPQPSISIRVWNESPHELMMKAAEVTRIGLGMPAYYNDEVIIPAMTSHGVSLEDARDYGIIGCVEPQKGGKTQGWHDAAFFNMAKVLEVTFNNGMDNGVQIGLRTGDFASFRTFDELLDAYKKQMEYFVKLLINADNSVDLAHAERVPLPFTSSMVYDCIGRGKTIEQGGAFYNFTGPQGVGVANAVDSLIAVKKCIYDEKTMTVSELLDAMHDNFGGEPAREPAASTAGTTQKIPQEVVVAAIKKLLAEGKTLTPEQIDRLANLTIDVPGTPAPSVQAYSGKYARILELLDSAPKYGNDLEDIDMFAREVAGIYCKEVQKYRNPRGGVFQPGLYPVSANVSMGLQTGAMPDGRRNGTPLADGVSPISGHDTNGPTAAANSVARLDHTIASNGTLFNQKFHPSALAGESGLEKLVALVRGYFDQKGMHAQYNVVSREMLLDAQKNPDKYRNMVVRVAGYSAHFVALDKAVQNDIIARTEHCF